MAGKANSEEQGEAAQLTAHIDETAPPPEGANIPLTFLRGNYFRVVPANGFMASLTLDGDIYLSPWHQHNNLPAESAFEVTPSGYREGAGRFTGIVREVDVALTFSPEVAANLIELLQLQLRKLALRNPEVPNASASNEE